MIVKYRDGACYDGDVRKGNLPTGCGTMTWSNGDKYDGFYLEGKRRGYGVLEIGGKVVYRGEWFDNKKHGYGCNIHEDATYVGSYVRGIRKGFGVAFYKNGDVYVGEWENDRRSGKGTYIFANGNRIEGWWKDGEREGICFDVKKDGAIARELYRDGAFLRGSRIEISLRDRRYYDVSGIYGCFTKDGKKYYGKYLEYDKDEYKLVMDGPSLYYENEETWFIATYDNNVMNGETAGLENEAFDRSFFVNGKGWGFGITYTEFDVRFGFCKDGMYDGFGGIYEFDGQILFGEQAYGYQTGRVVYCSLYDKKAYTADYSSGPTPRDIRFVRECSDPFTYCNTPSGSQIGDYGICATEEEYLVGKVTCPNSVKMLDSNYCFKYDRRSGKIEFKSPDGIMSYSVTADGERSYTVISNLASTVTADGDVVSHFYYRKNGEIMEEITVRGCGKFKRMTMPIKPDGSRGDIRLCITDHPGIGCTVFEQSHKNDFIATDAFVYSGGTDEGYAPSGYGKMTFPGYGYIYGEWRGYYECLNAKYTPYSGKTVNVTVKNGVMTDPDGCEFRFLEME